MVTTSAFAVPRLIPCAAVCACALWMLSGPVVAQRFKWWQSERLQRELHLTVEQVTTIERIYDASLPERKRLRTDLDRLEQELRQLLDSPDPDERYAGVLIERVETARARRNEARTMMLFRIRRVLTPQQRLALARRGIQGQ